MSAPFTKLVFAQSDDSAPLGRPGTQRSLESKRPLAKKGGQRTRAKSLARLRYSAASKHACPAKALSDGSHHALLKDFAPYQLLLSQATMVEKKGSNPTFVHDEATVNAARSLLDSKRTYQFRIWAAPTNAVVASNVTAGGFAVNPLALPEFSGILSSLFDEYRVDHVVHHLRPIATGGITSGYDKFAMAVCNDYFASTVPTSWEVALARSESLLHPVCAQSGSAFFMYQSGMLRWVFKPPRIFGLAGTTASIGPYVDIGQAWPGACLTYAETTATNGTVTLTDTREFYLTFRMRR